MTRRLRPLAALALIALTGAGCATDDPGMGGDAATTTGMTGQATAVKLAACLRAHGVPHFPDPDARGRFPDFGIDVSPAVWRRATDACEDLTPPGTFSARRSPQQQSSALRFAACVREHGVTDFPDPVNGDPLIDTTKIPSSDAPGGMDILNAATAQCGTILKRATGGQG